MVAAMTFSMVLTALWKAMCITTILLPSMGIWKLGLVSSLVPKPRMIKPHQNHHHHQQQHCHRKLDETIRQSETNSHKNHNEANYSWPRRRDLLQTLVGAVVLSPTAAMAGIDVSGLAVESNPLDVFLGGTYYEDDQADREGIDGRISRRKYTIVEEAAAATPTALGQINTSKKKKDFFEEFADRPVRILGESTSISSSRDDALELTGNLFVCQEKGINRGKGCIVIDFSPLGGPKDAKGYWDEKEVGIRFVDSQRVWSKQ